LSARLELYKRNEKCTLFLTTSGGDPHAAFRIARCLRHHYREFRLAVPSYCKSAGTLIAVAANELAIGDLGELGPLDIQVPRPLEVMERSSGLDYMQGLQVSLMHAFQAFNTFVEVRRGGRRLPTHQAIELAAKVATGLVAPLYAQIDPTKIGEMQRGIQIAKDYGERLNAYAGNLKADVLDVLVAGYPSHSFVIDRKEAKNLFHRVEPMSRLEIELINTLWARFVNEDTLVHVCEPVASVAPEPPVIPDSAAAPEANHAE
jgi:hypothetical protein